MTLAYVGTEGHKLFAHYEANPGNAALCLSLRGSGDRERNAPCGPQSGESSVHVSEWFTLIGTRSPLGYNLGGVSIGGTPTPYFGENSYLATTANFELQLAAGHGGAARQGSHFPGRLHVQQVDGRRFRLRLLFGFL